VPPPPPGSERGRLKGGAGNRKRGKGGGGKALLAEVDDEKADSDARVRRSSWEESITRHAETLAAAAKPAGGAGAAQGGGDAFKVLDAAAVEANVTAAAMHRYGAIGGLIPRAAADEVRRQPPPAGDVPHVPAAQSVFDACDLSKFPPGALTAACNLPLLQSTPWTDADALARVSAGAVVPRLLPWKRWCPPSVCCRPPPPPSPPAVHRVRHEQPRAHRPPAVDRRLQHDRHLLQPAQLRRPGARAGRGRMAHALSTRLCLPVVVPGCRMPGLASTPPPPLPAAAPHDPRARVPPARRKGPLVRPL